MSITADNSFVLRDNTKTIFGGSVKCFPKLDNTGDTTIDVQVIGAGTEDYGSQIGGIELVFTTSELTVFTASGANEVEKYYNLCEQAVKAYLGGLSDNSGVTFTIA